MGAPNIPAHRQRAYQASDAELRAVQVIDLASQLGTEGFQGVTVFDPLGMFLEHVMGDAKFHPSIADLAAHVRRGATADDEDDEDDGQSLEETGEMLSNGGFYGVAVQFGTPVRQYRSDTGWWSGWSRIYTQWIYADSLDAAWKLGLAWAEQQASHDLAKFKATVADAEKGGAA